MPRTHRTWPSSAVPIEQVPPREVVEALRTFCMGRNIPEAVRAEQMIEHLAALVERLGGEVVKGSLFEQPAEVAGTVEWPHDHDHMEQQPHDAAGGRDE